VSWFAASAVVWLLAALLCAFVPWRYAVRTLVGVFGTVLGAACLAAATPPAFAGKTMVWDGPAFAPFGSIVLRLDPLAAVFLLPIAVIGALATVYASGYARLGHGPPSRASSAALPVLLGSMALVVVAANTVVLLMAWEMMTISSWLLLSEDHRDREVRSAGLNYLIAGHISGASLALLFTLLSPATGWRVPLAALPPDVVGLPPVAVLFALLFVGFGTKAAIAPLHAWLPDAHSAAPSHVSGLMSGVLVTLGIYGFARFIPLLGAPSRELAITLIALGALGSCGAVVMSLSQGDVKRVLAYSTIEGAGLSTIGIGAAVLASRAGQPFVAALAWTAVLLQTWNNAVAKGLLFFAAGAMARRVESRDLEDWGGLLRRLPLLSLALIAGAATLAGIPGTQGFSGVWMLLSALFHGSRSLAGADRLLMLLAVVAVAFTEGMAVASFVRVVGVGLLGHPRSSGAAGAQAPRDPWLLVPVLILAAACFVLVAMLGPMLALLAPAVSPLVGGASFDPVRRLAAPLPWLAVIPLALAAWVWPYRAWLRRARAIRRAVTWDCGYARPAPTMQYSASSLSQPVTRMLAPALGMAVRWRSPAGQWPAAMSWESSAPERALAGFYRPLFTRVSDWLGHIRWLQQGQVMVYLRYLAVALLVLLVWLFWPVGASG